MTIAVIESATTADSRLSTAASNQSFINYVADLQVPRSGAQPFIGKIDEFRVWDHARSAQEIAANYRRSLTGNEPGRTSDKRAHRGVAPMAARSLRLTASALCPMSAGVEKAREKCTPSTTASVVTTSRSFLTGASTAASSPGPTRTVDEGRGSRASTRAKRACSPRSATFMDSRSTTRVTRTVPAGRQKYPEAMKRPRFAVWGGSLNLR